MLPFTITPDPYTTFPATRITKISPTPVSNKISGATRESEQLTIIASGYCAFASDLKSSGRRPPAFTCPFTNRAFPSINFFNAASGSTAFPLGSSANAPISTEGSIAFGNAPLAPKTPRGNANPMPAVNPAATPAPTKKSRRELFTFIPPFIQNRSFLIFRPQVPPIVLLTQQTSKRLSGGDFLAARSIQKLPNQPHMPKRIDHRPLQHSPNRFRANDRIFMLFHFATLRGPRRHSLGLHNSRIIHKQLNPHRRKSHRQRPLRPKLRRLRRQKKSCPANRETRNHVPRVSNRPIQFRPKRLLVKLHRCLRIIHRQHHRNLSRHRFLLFVRKATNSIERRLSAA